MSLDILVLGAGIGLCVQVLTIIVQARITFLRTSASHVGERLWSCRSGLPPARKHSV